MIEGRQHTDSRQARRHIINMRRLLFGWGAAGEAADCHCPGHCLGNLVETKAMTVWSGGTEARYVGEDYVGLNCLELIISDTERLGCLGAEVLNDYIRALHQLIK